MLVDKSGIFKSTGVFVSSGLVIPDDGGVTPPPSGVWDLDALVFANDTFSFNSIDTAPQSVVWHPDGLGEYFYVSGNSTDTIYELQAQTPFIINNALLTGNNLDVSAYINQPWGFVIKPEFDMILVMGIDGMLHEWTINTNLGNTTYNGSKDLSAIINSPRDFDTDSSGTNMVAVNYNNDLVVGLQFGTAWDKSTITSTGKSISVAGQEGNPLCIAVKDDGKEFMLGGIDASTIFQYTIGTAWDLNNASVTKTKNVGHIIYGIDLIDTGAEMLIINQNTDTIERYSTQ